MKTINIFLVGVFSLIILASCNKTKTTSNKFLKAGNWQVIELKVNDVAVEEIPSWVVEDCDVYDESCYAEWTNTEGGKAEFIWQFREKGEVFEISNQSAVGEDDHSAKTNHGDEHNDEAIQQCAEFSGIYTVLNTSKSEMEFESQSTIGHSGEKVYIKIQKK